MTCQQCFGFHHIYLFLLSSVMKCAYGLATILL